MNVYLIIIIILFILAISDLIVGISNDAANFINSSLGSKAAPVKVILSIAGLGVIIGATFSSGMMEIARSGIFHPGQFYFSEIMIIFLAVMITDVILLDTFNSFGFPTSTTVSIVFELLGAAVVISLIKIHNSTDNLSDIGNYINTAKALAIIFGILFSVVIAFAFGTVIQFITRLIFSFDYKKYLKYFGAVWGGIAITAIVYFILVKGAKGASFMTPEKIEWLSNNTLKVLFYSFIGFTIILQMLISFFKVNILRIIVLVGTFSLAMAFAGNDLVNFIGVPLAGFESYREFIANPSINPDTMLMGALSEPVKTPTIFLVGAGLIMVATLFLSKKSRTVSQTEISLARQGAGSERFQSSRLSRSVVRHSVGASKFINRIIPDKVTRFIDNRFDFQSYRKKLHNPADVSSFDLLRGSVNMFVASSLIAFGTSLKLPLSTTYVTFMVAMGTSLADRAWGRESAVYRITGVVTVIAGWFFTAITAFTVAFLIAFVLHWGGIIAAVAGLAVALFIVIRSAVRHNKKVAKSSKKDELDDKLTLTGENILYKCNTSITDLVVSVQKLYSSSILNLIKEDWKKMKKVKKSVDDLNQRTKDLKYNLYPTLRKLEEEFIETGPYYVQILDYLREIAHCLKYISDPVYEHLDNNHPSIIPEQIKDLQVLSSSVNSFYNHVQAIIRDQDYKDLDKLLAEQQKILDYITKIKKKQIKYIKSESVGTRNTLMYLNLLSESKNLLLYTVNMVKSHRDFLMSDALNVKS
ncbi:MAG: inorganic phosphate transporter [Bacteroidales bacterium]|nr:inorganic phosphate transporter [Bacteroidales bacterium]